jgi:hypothetical protein
LWLLPDSNDVTVADALASNKARILVVDIERLPGLAPIFDQRVMGGFISAARWWRLPQTLCFAAQWYGQRDMMFHAAWHPGGFDGMVQASWDLYDQADIICGFNQKRFDNEKLRGDWAVAGLNPPRPWKDVDLYVYAKKFGFESKSLAHLCQRLDLPGKLGHYDPEVAEAAMDGDAKAQASIERYNRGDVRATSRVYKRMLPYIHNHPHVNTTTAELSCNKCGRTDLTRLPTNYRANALEYPQFRCRCGGLVRDGANVRRFARTVGVQ